LAWLNLATAVVVMFAGLLSEQRESNKGGFVSFIFPQVPFIPFQ